MCAAQPGSDVITKTARERINWASYKISQTTDRLGVFVSIVSTKIPYKGAGKEYIGAFRSLLTHRLWSLQFSQRRYVKTEYGAMLQRTIWKTW